MELREYQKNISKRAAVLLKKFQIAYLAMECRTGKTITAFETARLYGAKSVLFVTKKKALPSVKTDFSSLQEVAPPFAIDIVNYESAHNVVGCYDLVIIDEAHSLGAYPRPSKRTQAVKKLCKGKPIIYMSGTPSPESFSQLYHQFWVSDRSPFTRWPTFYKWAHEFVYIRQRKVNGFTINDYSHADKGKIDVFSKHLFLTYTQDEAGFSTNIKEHNCHVVMEKRTWHLVQELTRYRIVTLDTGEAVLGDTPAKLLNKLHQLSSGTVITENGDYRTLDESKAIYIRNHFKGKTAIFYVYKSEFDVLTKYFSNWTDNPEDFQVSTDKTFICQVRRAREGVRLDTADALVFYNVEYSYLSYEQGKNRLVSKERTTPADVYFLCSDCGIENAILDAVRAKKDFTLQYYRQHCKNATQGT